jgi:hypothetical protein
MDKNTTYVNSTMDEVYSHCSELYEAMMDMVDKDVFIVIKSFKRVLSDIQKSYNGESQD